MHPEILIPVTVDEGITPLKKTLARSSDTVIPNQ
jgi:hypothetical protein